MIGLWMAYAMVVALLLGGAALVLERVLRLHGREARSVWAAALAGSWLLPIVMWLRPPETGGPAASGSFGGGGIDPALLARLLEGAAAAPATSRAWVEPLGDVLLAAWVILALGAIGFFALAVRRVATRSRSWPRRRLLGEPVRVSPDFGPAVVGLRRPEIVLPRWVMELGSAAQDLVLRHEQEHRDARDTLLLAAGTVATLAAPWNPALWWQLRRLRLAVELDCDARVLGRGVSRRSYGDLLLSVGERMGGSVVPVAALAEPPSFLERRLRMITEAKRSGSVWKVAAGLAIAGVLVAVACETPAPTVADEDRGAALADQRAVEAEAVERRAVEERARVERIRERHTAPEEVEEAESLDGRIRLRGVRSLDAGRDEPLVYIDGVRMPRGRLEDGEAGGPRLGSVRPDDIDRIEIIKGEAARTLYGDEAAGGIIQIFTKEAEEDDAPVVGEIRAKEVPEPEEPSLSRRVLDVAERGLTRAVNLIARPLRSGASSGEPLILVDGEEWSPERLDALDAGRIDRVEVVKGDAAREGWGERGANGVVKIFLKN